MAEAHICIVSVAGIILRGGEGGRVIVFTVCEGFSPLHYSLFLLYQQKYGREELINRRGIGKRE